MADICDLPEPDDDTFRLAREAAISQWSERWLSSVLTEDCVWVLAKVYRAGAAAAGHEGSLPGRELMAGVAALEPLWASRGRTPDYREVLEPAFLAGWSRR